MSIIRILKMKTCGSHMFVRDALLRMRRESAAALRPWVEASRVCRGSSQQALARSAGLSLRELLPGRSSIRTAWPQHPGFQ